MSQRVKPGDILAIPLKDGKKWMYLRKYEDGNEVFLLVTNEILHDVSTLNDTKRLLFTGVYKDVITSGAWKKIGVLPFGSDQEGERPATFVHDGIADVFRYYRYGEIDGELTFEEAYDSEMALAHEQRTLERILDHYIDTGFYHPRCWDICKKDIA